MKSYTVTCVICGAEFIAHRTGAYTCGSTCRKKKSRKKKEQEIWLIRKRNAQNEDRILNLKKQLSILEKNNEELTKGVPSNEELKSIKPTYPDDVPKNNTTVGCTAIDLWILMARLLKLDFGPRTGEFIEDLSFRDSTDEIIKDFETRFDCTFREARDAFPRVQPGKGKAENQVIINQYGKLEYSK